MDKMAAMILAGGQGRRMEALCSGRAKPLLPFAGGFRVIDFALTNCVRSAVKNIVTLVDHERLSVSKYVQQWQAINGRNLGIHVLPPKTDSYKGTADAVYQHIDYVKKQKVNDVLILAADHVYKMDYRKMLAFHRYMGADVTIGVVSVPMDQTHRFGVVKVDAEGEVTEFVEKPSSPKSNLVSMGIYIFNKHVLLERLEQDAKDPNSPHDFGHAIIPRMIASHRVFAYRFSDYWQDIGSANAYYRANMDLLRQSPAISMNTNWSILTRELNTVLLQKIHSGRDNKNNVVSSGCIIDGDVQNSILSPGVKVGRNAVVRNSLLLSNVAIGQHSIVENCILDENVNVGNYCHVGSSTIQSSPDGKITVVGNGTVVPDLTEIDRNCSVLNNIVNGDFFKNITHPNAVSAVR